MYRHIFEKIVIAFFVFLSLGSCRQKDIDDNLPQLYFLNNGKAVEIAVSDLVDSITYIPLNTAECLLGYVERVQRDGDFLFVKDNNGLHVFNKFGDYINSIGKKGQGPQEYAYINSFYLDRKNRHVCIISYPDLKHLEYSYSGEFVSVTRLTKEDAYVSSIYAMYDGCLLVHRPLPNERDNFIGEYTLLQEKDSKFVSYLLLEGLKNKSLNALYSLLYYPMTFWKGNYYAISTFLDVVYRYDDKALVPEFRLGLTNMAPSKDFMKKHADKDIFSLLKVLDEERIGKGITFIAGTDNYLFMGVSHGQTVVYDGEKAVLLKPNIYHSDVDAYFYSLITSGINGDMLGVYDAEFLKSKEYYILQGDNSKLKEMVEGLNEDDNPVVFQCYWKKDLLKRIEEIL